MGAAEVAVGRFCALLAFLATAAYLAGFSTPWWLEGDHLKAKAGLWQNCVGGDCVSTVKVEIGDWLMACQALSITALLTSLMALGVIVVMMCASRPSAVAAARCGVITTTLLTGIVVAITLVIYYLQRELAYPADFYRLSTSFFLVLVGGALFLATSLMMTINAVITRLRQSSSNHS